MFTSNVNTNGASNINPSLICYLANCVKNGQDWNIDIKGFNLEKITCYQDNYLTYVKF